MKELRYLIVYGTVLCNIYAPSYDRAKKQPWRGALNPTCPQLCRASSLCIRQNAVGREGCSFYQITLGMTSHNKKAKLFVAFAKKGKCCCLNQFQVSCMEHGEYEFAFLYADIAQLKVILPDIIKQYLERRITCRLPEKMAQRVIRLV